jgi:hypothetical protein
MVTVQVIFYGPNCFIPGISISMNEAITCQGRLLQPADICWLRYVVQKHPNWSRHKITKHICSHWGRQTHSGQPKTFAARSMIDKLEQRGLIDLPAIRVAYRRKPRPPFPEGFTAPKLIPLSFFVAVSNSYEDNCVGYYLNRHHYWIIKYAHPIHMVETFVERNLFKGTQNSYRLRLCMCFVAT